MAKARKQPRKAFILQPQPNNWLVATAVPPTNRAGSRLTDVWAVSSASHRMGT